MLGGFTGHNVDRRPWVERRHSHQISARAKWLFLEKPAPAIDGHPARCVATGPITFRHCASRVGWSNLGMRRDEFEALGRANRYVQIVRSKEEWTINLVLLFLAGQGEGQMQMPTIPVMLFNILVLALFGVLFFSYSASAEDLNDYHPECITGTIGMSPPPHPETIIRGSDCTAAIHRYCERQNRGGAGFPQEIGSKSGRPIHGVACFKPSWYGDVPLNLLAAGHSGCNNIDKSQSADCMSAVHRWCAADGRGGAGLAQEVGPSSFGVACFQPSSYQDVSINDLRAQIGGCDSVDKSQTSACLAAIHRWCNENHKGTAGLAQEVGNGVLGVACLNSAGYSDVAATYVLH